MYPEQPKVLGSWSASVVWSASSPPVPFGSYRFSRPGNDSIHPAWRIKQYSNLGKTKAGIFIIYEIWLKPKLIMYKKTKNNCGYCPTYATVSRLVHVPFHLPGIRYKVLHSSVLQSCRIWGREYGLYPVTETILNNDILYSYLKAPNWDFYNEKSSQQEPKLRTCHVSKKGTYNLCTRWLRRSCVTCSCHAFLVPVADIGAAAGRLPMEPTDDPSDSSWLQEVHEKVQMLQFQPESKWTQTKVWCGNTFQPTFKRLFK